ncbi:NAD(P)H-dependent glycerol-3-phosphate dehydrogenase [Clostridium sp. SHJSY1]|uniref:NAD(P)H-dependent glycerol-3-phosphate dehydrogenase n=1 Tax=Clostridium sp. SHJSY1 TaxID=2942483 RepID=UPI0028758838|nr:NAD(P)H-dependent glycerol-3-phosphate dehydrogenase [Clostridium sp. SHJSY1]MDS0524957.1 NAD(P)H-dependent glycerol-3-phosphate dehydrogenase [Clostridium sp. SHJSY1]
MSKIAFVGGGSFGTALAILLAKKGHEVSIYDRDETVINDINNNRRNDKYIKDLIIPESVKAYSNLEEAVKFADYLVLAIPSHVIKGMAKEIKKVIDEDIPIISIAKGIDPETDERLSVVIEYELKNPVVILSGPSHAEEVAAEIPTTIVVTSRKMEYAEDVQDLFMTNDFRVYTNEDIIGVEIGGAVKNIIALASGVIDGLGFGDNTKAALMTRGMAEITRIGIALGGKAETFYGLTGMGDLIVTCTSMHSRNRRAGILIGQGKKMEESLEEVGMIVEGVKACKAFYDLKEKVGVSMPITDALYKVLFMGKEPKVCVSELMVRDKKSENY